MICRASCQQASHRDSLVGSYHGANLQGSVPLMTVAFCQARLRRGTALASTG